MYFSVKCIVFSVLVSYRIIVQDINILKLRYLTLSTVPLFAKNAPVRISFNEAILTILTPSCIAKIRNCYKVRFGQYNSSTLDLYINVGWRLAAIFQSMIMFKQEA